MRALRNVTGGQLNRFGKCIALALAFTAIAFSHSASAQEQPAQPPTSCQLVLPVLDERGRQTDSTPPQQEALLATCAGRGVYLGPADNFRSFANVPDDILLVEVIRHGHRQVYLLTVTEEGQPIVQDLTLSIALAAGLGPTSRIDDLVLGYSRIPVQGEIAITGRRVTDSEGRTSVVPLDRGLSVRLIASSARQRNPRASTGIGGGAS